jgi:hypothetical protein
MDGQDLVECSSVVTMAGTAQFPAPVNQSIWVASWLSSMWPSLSQYPGPSFTGLGWTYLRGLLLARDLKTSSGYSPPVLMCNKGNTTTWYTATGLLGQGRGVQVYAVKTDNIKVGSLMRSMMGKTLPMALLILLPHTLWLQLTHIPNTSLHFS